MTAVEPKMLGEMEALVEERHRYENWIRSLDERRGSVSPHVFERVLSDYKQRLQSVVDTLAGRSSELGSAIEAIRERLSQLQQEEASVSDERAEAELRALVGEYGADRWDSIRRTADENIARLSAGRAELSAELANLERIMGAAVASPASQPRESASDSGIGTGSVEEERTSSQQPAPQIAASMESAEEPRADTPEAVSAAEGQFDELAFLSSVVENEIAHLPQQPADIQRTERAQPQRSVVAEPRPHVERAASKVAAPPSSQTAKSATPLITEPIHMGAPDEGTRATEEVRKDFRSRLSGSVPAYLKDVPKETSKSLKCQECGSMNYPTEWYCERCGGELAAL